MTPTGGTTSDATSRLASLTRKPDRAADREQLDALLDESSLFPTNSEVERSWEILDPVLEYWAEQGTPDEYEAGTWGPASADRMLAKDGRTWRRP